MSGTLTEIKVAEGDTVDVGTVLAVVGDAGAAPARATEAPAAEARCGRGPCRRGSGRGARGRARAARPCSRPLRPRPPAPAAEAAPAASGDGGGRLLSPVVRRLIAEHGLDPATIQGTGVGGRITRKDVLAVADAQPARPAAAPAAAVRRSSRGPRSGAVRAAPEPMVRSGERDTSIPLSNIRKRTAEHMVRSIHTSAHVYVSIEVDYEGVDKVRRANKDAWKAEEGFSLTYLPFVARAVADAIHEFPEVNATFTDEALVVHNYLNLGIAVDLDFKGLMVPVIRDADGKRLRQLAREVSDLAGRARSKKLTPDDIQGGTFTITNPGPFGTLLTLPIINQPQVAILSTDGVKRRPVVVDAARRQREHRHPLRRQPGPRLRPPGLRRRLRLGLRPQGQGPPRDP